MSGLGTLWHSVTERLPDDDLAVLVWDGGDTWVAHLEGGTWYWAEGMPAGGITHWAELPEGPQS